MKKIKVKQSHLVALLVVLLVVLLVYCCLQHKRGSGYVTIKIDFMHYCDGKNLVGPAIPLKPINVNVREDEMVEYLANIKKEHEGCITGVVLP